MNNMNGCISLFECWNHTCSECQNKDEIVMTSSVNGNVVGKMVCVKEVDDILHLSMIETDPGKGIGRKMMQHLVQYCQMNKITYVYLYPHATTARFFQKMGFQYASCTYDTRFNKYIHSLHDAEMMSHIMYKIM